MVPPADKTAIHVHVTLLNPNPFPRTEAIYLTTVFLEQHSIGASFIPPIPFLPFYVYLRTCLQVFFNLGVKGTGHRAKAACRPGTAEKSQGSSPIGGGLVN